MHIEPWEGALLPRRSAWLLEGVGGPPGRWNPGVLSGVYSRSWGGPSAPSGGPDHA